MRELRSKWENLAERERTMVSIVGVIVGIFIVYALIWDPLTSTVSDHQMQVTSQQQLLQYLKNTHVRIQQMKSAGIEVDGVTASDGLSSIVGQTLSAQSLTTFLKEEQQPQPNTVSLKFVGVPFDKLMSWLESLASTHGLKVKQFSMTRNATVGTADVQVVLSSNG